jgi:hypothetical protein
MTKMDAIIGASWLHNLGIGVMIWGLALVWRGLRGGPNGHRGLVRRGIEMVDRLEGWRLFLLGLTVTGLGAAWYWDQRWLLVLSLGFGFTELHESTHILRAWRYLAVSHQPSASQPAGRHRQGRPVRDSVAG